jgi:hypothetical protein
VRYSIAVGLVRFEADDYEPVDSAHPQRFGDTGQGGGPSRQAPLCEVAERSVGPGGVALVGSRSVTAERGRGATGFVVGSCEVLEELPYRRRGPMDEVEPRCRVLDIARRWERDSDGPQTRRGRPAPGTRRIDEG